MNSFNPSQKQKLAVILGSGLEFNHPKAYLKQEISYEKIFAEPKSTLKGHKRKAQFWSLERKDILIMNGRFHLYEGYSLYEAQRLIRYIQAEGYYDVLITAASGGIGTKLKVGDLVSVESILDFQRMESKADPLEQLTDPPKALESASFFAGEERVLAGGCYAAVRGPNYETPAEIKFFETLGANLVGMSMLPEVLAAEELGLSYGALSIVTNICQADSKPTHEEVIANARAARDKLTKLIASLLT